jgi:hypothetical protein
LSGAEARQRSGGLDGHISGFVRCTHALMLARGNAHAPRALETPPPAVDNAQAL